MVKHNEETKHSIALSFSDLSFWCYDCDTYVISSKFTEVYNHFYKQKFGNIRQDDVEGLINKISEMHIGETDSKDKEAVTDTESKVEEDKTEDEKTPEEEKMVKTEEPKKDGDEEEKAFSREEFIQKLKNGEYKKITLLTGAGISVSAGIPDFRSPHTGLYTTLKGKYDMDDPSEIFNLETFIKKPEMFYNFSKEFNWDQYDPTPTHYFIGFLHHKGLLDMNFTQNIDGLELKAGIPNEKVIAAHGNLSGAHCPKCKIEVDLAIFKEHVEREEVWYCEK